MNIDYEARKGWANSFDYVVVTSAAVVGIGNFIAFPAAIAQYGAGFFWIYLLSLIVVSIPVFFCASILGHHAQHNPVTAMQILSMEHKVKPYFFQLFKVLIVGLVVGLASYTIMSGEILAFLFHHNFPGEVARGIVNYKVILSETGYEWAMGGLFILMALFFNLLGIRRGIRFISYLSMLLLVLICVVLLVYIGVYGELLAAFKWLTLSGRAISVDMVIRALALAFFSLSVGMGVIVTYSSYLPLSSRLWPVTFMVIFVDVIISIAAALIIGGALYATHTMGQVTSGEQLLFGVLPAVLMKLPFSSVMPYVFYAALFLAALTSAVAIAEPVITTMRERWNISRASACALLLLFILLFVGLYWLSVANAWSLKTGLLMVAYFCDEYLPFLGVLLMLIFVGWKLDPEVVYIELARMPDWMIQLFLALVRFVAPVLVMVLFVLYVVYR